MYIPQQPSRSSDRQWRSFQIKVPLEVAAQIEAVQKKSGAYKTSFLKLALVLGTAQLAEAFDTLDPDLK